MAGSCPGQRETLGGKKSRQRKAGEKGGAGKEHHSASLREGETFCCMETNQSSEYPCQATEGLSCPTLPKQSAPPCPSSQHSPHALLLVVDDAAEGLFQGILQAAGRTVPPGWEPRSGLRDSQNLNTNTTPAGHT